VVAALVYPLIRNFLGTASIEKLRLFAKAAGAR
jgi:hypothetical protein